jgi:hypothetical protein
MLVKSLMPWPQLTRNGIPEFRVIRRPLTLSGRVFEVGETVPFKCVTNRHRLRQFYQQRLVEPVNLPPGTKQAALKAFAEKQARAQQPAPAPVAVSSAAAPVPVSVIPSVEVPVAQESASTTVRPARRSFTPVGRQPIPASVRKR